MGECVRCGRSQTLMELPLEANLEGVVVRRGVIAVDDETVWKRAAHRNRHAGNTDEGIAELRDGVRWLSANQVSSRSTDVRHGDALMIAHGLLYGDVELQRVRQRE